MGVLAALAMLLLAPAALAQQSPPGPPQVLPEPPVTPSPTPRPPRPTPTNSSTTVPGVPLPPNRPDVLPDEVVNTPGRPAEPQAPAQPQAAPEVKGDVVSRPLPRTGNDIGGTAVFGGALTVLGIALALGARRRRIAFDGA